jgi:LysM repeat protein
VSQPPPVQQSEPPAQDVAPPAGSQTYVVESDDTLWDIADRFGTTVEAIVAANNLANAADLQIGQELIIPPPDSGAAEEPAPVGDEVPVSGE